MPIPTPLTELEQMLIYAQIIRIQSSMQQGQTAAAA